MCGIIGYITEEPAGKYLLDRDNFMRMGLIIDTLRGADSTGVFYGNYGATGNSGFSRMVADGYAYTKSKDFTNVLKDSHEYRFVIGHNRSATVGAVDLEGTHPFQVDTVTGCHNGTLRGTHYLPITQAESKVDVDSHCLFMNIASVEPEDVCEKVLERITGAFALVWHDSRDGSLNITRNTERPLHMMQSYADETIYFASEDAQLMYLDRKIGLAGANIMFPEPGQLLKWKEGSLKPEITQYDLFKATYHQPYANNSGWVPFDESEDYEPVKPGKYLAPADTDDRVLVGGRKRAVPDECQLELMAHNLTVEDRISFTPLAVQQSNLTTSTPYVLGHLDAKDMPALIYQVEPHVADAAFNRRWTVRPVAIKYTDAAGLEPLVICRLVSSLLTGKTPYSLVERGGTDGTPTEIGGYRGMDGQYVSKQEWMEQTAEGCIHCEKPIQLKDASSIEWVEGLYPMCVECSLDIEDDGVLDYCGVGPDF